MCGFFPVLTINTARRVDADGGYTALARLVEEDGDRGIQEVLNRFNTYLRDEADNVGAEPAFTEVLTKKKMNELRSLQERGNQFMGIGSGQRKKRIAPYLGPRF